MALESLINSSYSSKSDVWSFAVVVWELFTLGRTYLFRLKLLEGEGLEDPELAPKPVHLLLGQCWKEGPSERPDFGQIQDIFESLNDADGNNSQ